MKFLTFTLFSLVVLTSATDSQTNRDLPEDAKLSRSPRSYDGFINSIKDANVKDSINGFMSSKSPKPSRMDNYPNNFHRGYDGFSNYDSYNPSGIQNFKGLQDGWTGVMFPNADQELEMVTLMNAMNKLNSLAKEKEQGFLSNLLSDPKSIALSAVVPLSILLFAVLPFLANRFMAGTGMPEIVTTVASSRIGHVLRDPKVLESVVQNLAEFASRSFEEDACIQKTVCEVAVRKGGLRNARSMAQAIRRYSKESWLKTMGAMKLVNALEKGDCKNMCNRSESNSPRKRQ